MLLGVVMLVWSGLCRYNALNKAADFVTQSKGEIYLGAPRGHACFFPGLPWWPTGVPP